MNNKKYKIHPLIRKVMELEAYAMKNHYWFAISSINIAKNTIGQNIVMIQEHKPKDNCKGWD